MSTLFDPLSVGALSLRNRIVMAPMARSRADAAGRVGPMTATYYAQRASAGMIISEGIFPSVDGKGYVRTPGLTDDAQERSWRAVTRAVHDRGGRIVAQLMHAGRISHPSFMPGGVAPVAPSAVRPQGSAYTAAGPQPFETPRALEIHEIPGIVEAHRLATERAFRAGFDAVELHAASGYLSEQFLSSSTNLRTDAYGGSIAARARFVLELLEAIVSVRGADRVGLKIAPELGFNDVADATPEETYLYLAGAASRLGVAYLHIVRTPAATDYPSLLRPRFGGALLLGGGLTHETAADAIETGAVDAAVFGAPFIANPDLPDRLARGHSLATADRATFYSEGPRGYIDYPAADAGEAAVR